jgi:hypothetical protein
VVGTVSGVLSAITPLSYDEGLWLAVTRRMDLGARLYRDLLDNKTPPVYWMTRALDHLPGPFHLARGLFFGALIAAVAHLVSGLASRLGVTRPQSIALGSFAGALVALQSSFVLNIETPVVVLLTAGLWLIATDRVISGAALAAAATTIDLRAVAFFLAVILFAKRTGSRHAWIAAATVSVVGGSWLAVVLLNDRLRYSLVELNAATRGTVESWNPVAVVAIMLAALAPVVAAGAPYLRRWDRVRAMIDATPSGALLLLTGLAIGIASRFPFLKYWALIIPAMPVLLAAWIANDARSREPATADVRVPLPLVFAAFAPLFATVLLTQVPQSRLVSRYEAAARTLERTLGPSDTFASFDPQPFMTTLLPEHAALPWATLDYLGVRTSHRDDDLRLLAATIDRAAAVVDDGALSAPEDAIAPRFRVLWRLYREKVEGFTCVRTIDDITLRLRAGRCV